jgi:hypothetical protein
MRVQSVTIGLPRHLPKSVWQPFAMDDSWGYAGTAADFLAMPVDNWVASLSAQHQRLFGMPPAQSQASAWREQHGVLVAALTSCIAAKPDAAQWGVVCEYELPFEGGRRPDVVVLAGTSVVVLEFKSEPVVSQASLDQSAAYARDLAEYHSESHDRVAGHVVVLPRVSRVTTVQGRPVVGADEVAERLLALCSHTPGQIPLEDWLDGAYDPLPTLVDAARRIFQEEDLPHVRRALSAGIPQTLDAVSAVVDAARDTGTRRIVFLTGVPGAGKTLVGLRLVYERSGDGADATFLSGNGPLVQVLQDALKSTIFVRDLHKFIQAYGVKQKVPPQHVVVFDEAQRAWDAEYMSYKGKADDSEPSLIVQAGDRIPDWAVLVGLVGEGQEIHCGEEGGMPLWDAALRPPNAAHNWTVHCPPHLAPAFADHKVQTSVNLDLNISLRSRTAEYLHEWVAALLDGDLEEAADFGRRVADEGFPLYVSRDLDEIREYIDERFAGEPDKTTGLLASSHAKNLEKLGIRNGFMATSRMNIAAWYNAPPDDPRSGCQLLQPVTEFGCQGLELDLPVVCWGTDLLWVGDAWAHSPTRRRFALENPVQVLTNAYRVLLTRGRDGLVVFVPEGSNLDATTDALRAVGCRDADTRRSQQAELPNGAGPPRAPTPI